MRKINDRALAFFLVALAPSSAALSAVPGLPFTEDFTDKALCDATRTLANWNLDQQALELAKRHPLFDAFGSSTTGVDISADSLGTFSMARGDVDGDGDLDLVAGNYGQRNKLYLNNGTSTSFSGVTGTDITRDVYNTQAIALGDVDGDGDLDVVTGSWTQDNRLYLNNGTSDPFSGVTGSDITTDAYMTYSIALGDVNGDGRLDLVTANVGQPNRLYLNNGTSSPFAGVVGTDITADAHSTYGIGLADMDGDGDLDVVAGNVSQPNRLYLNNGTSSPFSGVTGTDITADTYNTQSLALADMNGDGHVDLVAGNWSQTKRLYLNNGSGTPFSGVVGKDIGGNFDFTWSIALGDVDGDGSLDLVTGNDSSPNRLYLNNGTPDPFAGVTTRDLTTDSNNVRSVILGDMDGDGDLDAMVGNSGQPNRLYLNPASSNPFAGVTGSDVTADTHSTNAVTLGDVDGDGDLDIVAGNYGSTCRLYLNNGTSTPFSGVTGTDISTDSQGTLAIALGDVDGDGHLDVVTGNYSSANRLYLNNGTSTPFSGVTGTNVGSETDSTADIALGDVDGDGDLDVVVGNNNVPNRLYLNNGTSTPFAGVTAVNITADTNPTSAIKLADMDGDGDLDVVAGNAGQPNRLYLNNGTSTPFSGVTGSDIGSDPHTTYDLALGDMDEDGDLDVVAGNWMGTKRLYLNNGTSAPFSGVTGSDIGSDFDATWGIALGDVDGDGDLDLVTGNSGDSNRLYLNNGTSTPFSGATRMDITADAKNVRAIALGDGDGDGALDLVVGNDGEANRLYLNQAGPNPFAGVNATYTNSSSATMSIALGDVNGDGALDLVAGNMSTGNVLYPNNKTTIPFPGIGAVSITSDTPGTSSIALGDLDRDGDLDVVTGNWTQPSRLYLNNGTSTPFVGVTGANISSDSFATWSIALGDVDGDGDLDLVVGNRNTPSRLYLNNGTSTPFSGVTGSDITSDTYDVRSVALGDVDGDGDLDVVTGNAIQANRLYLNNGTADPFAGVSGKNVAPDTYDTRSVGLADMDEDGDLDVVAANYGEALRLYFNNGTADPFSGVSGIDVSTGGNNTLSVAIGDVNQDGKLDLVTGNYGLPNILYLNNGTATPWQTLVSEDADSTYSVVLGDVDGDGALDVMAGNYTQRYGLYRRRDFNTGQGQGVSLRVDSASSDIQSATLTSTADLPQNTLASTWMSNNAGAHWFLVYSGQSFTFPTSGHDLRWKADLGSLSPALSPWVDQIDINGVLAPTATPTPTRTPTATSTSAPTATPTPPMTWHTPGWGRTTSDQPLSGLVVYGDKNVMEMGGLAASAVKSKRHILAHFASSTRWYTGLAVANPSATTPANVTVVAYSNTGQNLGQAQQTVQPLAKMSSLLSSLIGPNLGTGWVEVTSDQDVTASLVYGDQISGGLGAIPSCPTGNSLILPHFVQSNRWWTGLAVLNTSPGTADVTLKAYDNAGTLLDETTQLLSTKNKIFGYVESILPLAAGKTGWILVESSSGILAGLSIYGDKQAVPNRIGALPGVVPSRDVYLSDFWEDSAWWTGVALVNPNGVVANVDMKAYKPNGILIGTRNEAVPALGKVTGMVSSLFTLKGLTRGWVKVSSDSPVAGLQMLNADDSAHQSWGLAAIEGQASAYALTYGHYTITAKWWTLFAMANPSDSSSANAQLMIYGDDGVGSGIKDINIPAKGRLSDYLDLLLGL